MSQTQAAMDGPNLLATFGVRHTRQRCAILQVLLDANVPLSAEHIHERTKEADANINLSTVYRFVEMLADKNLVTRSFNVELGRSTFELSRPHHCHHLTCTHCGEIAVIHDCPLGDLSVSLEQETGYSITGHRVELLGICPTCRRSPGPGVR